MEREWADALARGDKVKVKIDVEWPSSGATRPDAFNVTYEITDAATGTVTRVDKTFLNK